MSGKTNLLGSKSGVIGTVGEGREQGWTLLHNSNVNESGNAANKTFAENARGVGVGASGTGYLFQTDYFYYKVFTSGWGFVNGYPAMRFVDTSNNVQSASSYRYCQKAADSGGADHDVHQDGYAFIQLSERYDHADPHGVAGNTEATAGATMMEMTWFNPAGQNRTNVQWTYSQSLDADAQVRYYTGSSTYTSTQTHGGFNILSQNDGNFDGFIQCSVYGLASQGSSG